MQIIATSRSATHGFSKQPQAGILLIAGEGVEHDAHRGTTTQHIYLQRKDPDRPNLAQVHLFAQEILDELASKGFALQPGEIGENILTRGLDLHGLPEDTLLHLGESAVVRVTGLRTPCKQIDHHRAGLQQHLWGPRGVNGKRSLRCGIMSVVLAGGFVQPADSIRVSLPPEPFRALGPV